MLKLDVECLSWMLSAKVDFWRGWNTIPCSTNSYPFTSPTLQLADIVTHLISSSLQASSIPTYQHSWKLYQQFLTNIVGFAKSNFPIPQATLALFIAHLYQQGYAISTVNTYVSALGYSHRLVGSPDPSKVI